jgi:5-methylcytosine-specific restriction endonuclease McrA
MAWANGQSRTSTAEHRRWAATVKRNAGQRCQIRLPGCEGYADVADHIIPVAEGGAEFDPANGQGACKFCHDIKTTEEAARGRARLAAKAKHPDEQHPGLA